MKIQTTNTMKRAWEIARTAFKKHGGNVKDYFQAALKLAWKEIKKGKKLFKTDKVTMFEVLEKYSDKAVKAIGENNLKENEYLIQQLNKEGKEHVLNGFLDDLENTSGWKFLVSNSQGKLDEMYQKMIKAAELLDNWVNGHKPAVSYNK